MRLTGRFAEWRARRARALADRRERELAITCPDCGHNWGEHAGSGNDRDGVCGECAYEVEHGFGSADSAPCRREHPTSAL